MAKGDHLIVPLCGPMTHHGIDIGDGTVVHWSSGMPGGMTPENFISRKFAAEIRRTALAEFGDPSRRCVRVYRTCDHPDQVIQRALSKVGESGYCLFGNNCEHFATWCKTGERRSEQVKDASATAAGLSGGLRLAAISPVSGMFIPGLLIAATVAVPATFAFGLGWLAFNALQADSGHDSN